MKKKQEIPEEIREKETDGEETAVSDQPSAVSEDEAAEETAEPEAAPAKDAEGLAEDVAAFHALFPDVTAGQIPGEVWEQVEAGGTLTAAYAVHFVKALRDRERIDRLNAENEKAAPPPVRHDGKEESYFSPEAVRAMSRDEVRKHYQEILRSMDHWN